MSKTFTLLSGVTTTGAGSSSQVNSDINVKDSERVSFVATAAGSGTVSATVVVEVSNDNTNWATRLTFTLSGTTSVSDCDVDDGVAFKFYRGNVTAISGTSAAVTLTGYAS